MVRGAVAGLAATGGMTLPEILARSRWGLKALPDWQVNQTIAARMTKRTIEAAVIPGLGFHFLHGLLAGIVFVLALPLFPSEIPIWILGPGYGHVPFGITLVIHEPMTGRTPWSGRGRERCGERGDEPDPLNQRIRNWGQGIPEGKGSGRTFPVSRSVEALTEAE